VTRVSVVFRDSFPRRAARVQAEGTQQSADVALLRDRQTGRDVAKPLHVNWKHLVDQRPSFRGQLAEHDSLVLSARAPAYQSTLLELVHDIGRAGTGHENPVANLAEWQGALVVQHLQHRELGQAQSGLNKMRSHPSLDRLQRARKSDDQLQRRSPIAIRGG